MEWSNWTETLDWTTGITFHLSELAKLHNLQSAFDHNNVHVLSVPFHHKNALQEFHKDFHKDHKKNGQNTHKCHDYKYKHT